MFCRPLSAALQPRIGGSVHFLSPQNEDGGMLRSIWGPAISEKLHILAPSPLWRKALHTCTWGQNLSDIGIEPQGARTQDTEHDGLFRAVHRHADHYLAPGSPCIVGWMHWPELLHIPFRIRALGGLPTCQEESIDGPHMASTCQSF